MKICQPPVAHTYNPSYSGGRDQEDCSSKLAPANSSAKPYLKKEKKRKKTSQKRAGEVTQGVVPQFKSQYYKNKDDLRLSHEL
jgi:hypothetical protein